jgi:hypothetical protein
VKLDRSIGIAFFLISPLESAQDKFRERVNLLIEDLTGKKCQLNQI